MGVIFFMIGVGLLLGYFGVTAKPEWGAVALPLLILSNMKGNSMILIGGILFIIVSFVIQAIGEKSKKKAECQLEQH